MNNIGEKTQPTIKKKFCGIAVGFFVGFLIAFLIYPLMTQAEASVVFLRTTVPPMTDQFADEESPDSSISMSEIPSDNPEQRLVSDLMKDDMQVTYEKMDDQQQWQVVHMRVTGYCACPKCCGKYSDGVTASNHRIRPGDTFVAADKHYRFGTEMMVPGYNQTQPVKVLDRGRVIKGNRLDLYFDSHQQAKKWGVKYLDVLVKIAE